MQDIEMYLVVGGYLILARMVRIYRFPEVSFMDKGLVKFDSDFWIDSGGIQHTRADPAPDVI